jgi:hypothetical protein
VTALLLASLFSLAPTNFHLEPTIALTEVRLNGTHPLGAGIGTEAVFDWGGKLSVDFALLGSVAELFTGTQHDVVSVAPMFCYAPAGCVGAIIDLQFQSWTWHDNFGIVYTLRGDFLQFLHLLVPIFGG